MAKYMNLKINNSKEASIKSGKWKDPGAKLFDQLLNAAYFASDDVDDPRNENTWHYLREAYLVAPVKNIKYGPHGQTPYSRSGCKYPHHAIRNGELVVHQAGLKAAYSRAKQMGIFSGEVKEHLERHYKELGIYDTSTMKIDESIEHNFSDIESYIFESTGIALYSPSQLFDESFPGNLKSSFRRAINIQTHNIYKNESGDYQHIEVLDNLFNSINTPEELMEWMNKNIQYGYVDGRTNTKVNNYNNYDFYHYYILRNPEDLLTSKVGNCFDQTEFERKWFSSKGIENRVFYVEDELVKDDDHSFLLYRMNDKVCWFENAWSKYKGIREFLDWDEALESIKANFNNESNPDKNNGGAIIFELKDIPNFGINYGDYINWARNQKIINLNLVESLDIYQEAIDHMNDIDQFLFEQSQNKPSEMNIYPLNRTDVTSPYVVMERYHKDSEEGLKMENIGSDDLDWIEGYLMEEGEIIPPENKASIPPKPTEPEKPEKKESMPQKAAKAESSANGVRRKKLYIAFIEWAKSINPKNTFGSVFDKDAFHTLYPFVPHELRYFYRLANPMLCVLQGDLTFFAIAELKKLNIKNSRLSEMMIFAATKEDVRVFNNKDKKVYRGTEENGMLKLAEVLGDTFDIYLQKMINQGDILNGPIEESVEILPPINEEGRI